MSIGRTFRTASTLTSIGPDDAPIVGEDSGNQFAALRLDAGEYLTMELLEGDAGDAGNLPAWTVEFWVRPAAVTAGASQVWVAGPYALSPVTGIRQYFVQMTTTGLVNFQFLDSGGNTHTFNSVTALVANRWTHIVAAYGSNTQRIYLNGVEDNNQAAGGTCWPDLAAAADFRLGDSGTTVQADFDEVAFYRYELPAARVAAHYQAATQRGFPSQASGARINSVLDSARSRAPRNVQAGARTLTAQYMIGQMPLDELRSAKAAEAVDAVFFIARDGTATFLDSAHRSSSPYNTVQATFDDDGTDLPYQEATIDYSEAFLANEWNVTRKSNEAVTQTATDATSVSRYFKRPQSLTGIPVSTDGQASTIASAMLAKYKEPMTRITSITLTTADPNVTEAVFRRDIGDRIRVFRTQPGGNRIDQTLFIQKIDIEGAQKDSWRIAWGVSPV